MHPTVKPVALVADAIRDCSRRGDIVLDAFGGSGSTLIAAETCGRTARLIEFDPAYCDTLIARWQAFTGKPAVLVEPGVDGSETDEPGKSFEHIGEQRLGIDWPGYGANTTAPDLRRSARRGNRKPR